MDSRLRKYLSLYDLPKFRSSEEVSERFFHSCKQNHLFITVCIVDSQGRLLFIRDLNKSVGWELPGGFVKEDEDIQDAVHRVVLEEAGLAVDETRPIAYLQNIFEHKEAQIAHHGLAFTASIRGRAKEFSDNWEFMYSKDLPSSKIAYQNKKVVREARNVTAEDAALIPSEEIDSVKDNSLAYRLHRWFMKPLGASASKKQASAVQQEISPNISSVIDVTCGDDGMILRLEEDYDIQLAVANDISFDHIRSISEQSDQHDIIFTNHNVLSLPFEYSFDLVLFKNTLHHISESNQKEVLKDLAALTAGKLIVIDIEDPQRSNMLGYVWNYYYRNFLGDIGGSFLTEEEFTHLLQDTFPEEKISVDTIGTIKGKYLKGVVDFRQ